MGWRGIHCVKQKFLNIFVKFIVFPIWQNEHLKNSLFFLFCGNLDKKFKSIYIIPSVR